MMPIRERLYSLDRAEFNSIYVMIDEGHISRRSSTMEIQTESRGKRGEREAKKNDFNRKLFGDFRPFQI